MIPAIGYAIREQNRSILGDPALSAVEITFERADDPLRIEPYIGQGRYDYVSVHALKLSPASPSPPSRRYLDAILAVAEENDAASISDHLGFTRDRDGGVEMGHFAPPPYTTAALDAVCQNLEIIQRHFGDRHFFLENIAYLFAFEGEMSEAEFLARVLERSGCGWLFDVTNLYANALNYGYDAYQFVDRVMPHVGRVQMHLAGGFFDEKANMYIDSHSHPIPAEVFELYRYGLEKAAGRVDAVFIERDQNFPDEDGWLGELRQVRQIAEQAAGSKVSA